MPISANRIHTFAEWVDHAECVCVHPDGSLWCGGEAGQIYRISKSGKKITEICKASGGFILGIAFAPGGKSLIACDLFNSCLWHVDVKTKKMTRFADGAGGHRFAIPNHLVFSRDGHFYVTESGGFHTNSGKILKFDMTGRGEVWYNGPIDFANGIAMQPDEKALYFVVSFYPGIHKIDIKPDGSPGKRTKVIKIPKTIPDGLCFDARGNMYITCYTPSRIYKLTPKGKLTIFADDWTSHALSAPTNAAFGGENFDQLFTSNLSRWHITRIDARVKGQPLASHFKG